MSRVLDIQFCISDIARGPDGGIRSATDFVFRVREEGESSIEVIVRVPGIACLRKDGTKLSDEHVRDYAEEFVRCEIERGTEISNRLLLEMSSAAVAYREANGHF